MIKVLKILTCFIVFSFILSRPYNPVSAEVLFEDDFETLDSIWILSPSSMWGYIPGELFGEAHLGYPNPIYAFVNMTGLQDYEYYVDLKNIYGVDKTILFRINNNNSYKINLRSAFDGSQGNDLVLAKRIGLGTPGNIKLKSVEISNFENTWYTFKIRVENIEDFVKIGVSLKEKGEENFQKLFDYIDPAHENPYYSGGFGLEIWSGRYGAKTLFDSVLVKTIDPGINLVVPDFKQFDSRWASLIYDDANLWSDDPTIERWGCSLSSATMVLNYHGFDTNPKELNTWLSTQPDGFIRNGEINWLAISKFSYLYSAGERPILEFSRKYPGEDSLSELINNKVPPILRLPGHFVVAKGINDTHFLINDPASTLSKLSDAENIYGGNYQSMEVFTPSNTDLSYFLFISDVDTSISVFDPEGNDIKDGFFTLHEPIDPVSNIPADKPNLNSFWLPKPTPGIYKIEIVSNNQTDILDYYIYNEEGTPLNGSLEIKSGSNIFYSIYVNSIRYVGPIDFDYLLNTTNDSYINHYIKNRGIYKALSNQISLSRKYYVKNRIFHSLLHLSTFERMLRSLPTYLIDKDAREYLLQITKILKEDLI